MRALITLLLAGSSALMIALSLPLICSKVPRNRWYGFRTRKTLSSDERWYEANRFCGWALLAAGIWSAIDLLFIALAAAGLSDATLEVCWILALLIPLACAVIVSILYLKRIS